MDQYYNQQPKFNSKKVYFVKKDNIAFESDPKTKNGKEKAINYCFQNNISTNSIIVFDSEMEFKFYLYLTYLQDKGEISDIEYHREYLLIDKFDNANGETHDRLIYEADFVFKKKDKTIVVDTKGAVQNGFYIKRKLFDLKYKEQGLYMLVLQFKQNVKVESEEKTKYCSDLFFSKKINKYNISYLNNKNWINIFVEKKVSKRAEVNKQKLNDAKNELKEYRDKDNYLAKLKASYYNTILPAVKKCEEENKTLPKAKRERKAFIEETFKKEGRLL